MSNDKINVHTYITKVEINYDDNTICESEYEELNQKTQRELINILLKYSHDLILMFILYLNNGLNRFLLSKNWFDVRNYMKKVIEEGSNKEKILILSNYEKFIIPPFIKQHFIDCCLKESFLTLKKYYESVRTSVKEQIRKWAYNRKKEQEVYLKKIEDKYALLKEEIIDLEKDKKQNFQKIKDFKEKRKTLEKEIKSIKEKITHIDESVYYAYSILSRDIALFLKCLKRQTPTIEETFYNNEGKKFVCSDIERISMARRIRKFAKKIMRHPPTRKSYRSAYLDESLYEIKHSENNEYLSISLAPFKGVKINFTTKAFLNRHSKITKNITFIANDDEYYINIPFKLKEYTKYKTDDKKAIDLGYSEVFTDQSGIKYGRNFGKLLSKLSDDLNNKNRKRNKYFAQYKKEIEKGNIRKAKNILENNLGRKKYDKFYKKRTENIKNLTNYTINQLIGLHKEQRKIIGTLVIEELSSHFNLKFSKNMNRKLSSWTRGYIKERIKFKTDKFCIKLIQVNPAYTSQMCPECFYIDSNNRKGDKFKCQKCSYEGDADVVAAKNIFQRVEYSEITLYTPKEKVKEFFMQKHENLNYNTKENS